jgi:hypothetical protein
MQYQENNLAGREAFDASLGSSSSLSTTQCLLIPTKRPEREW